MTVELQREQKSFNNTTGETKNKRKMLFELDKITKSLGDKLLIKDFTVRILQKDVIAIVGPNGTGKSTMLKLFTEKLKLIQETLKRRLFNWIF